MLEIEVDFQVSGHKSSEGDGRTAADIEREMEEARRILLEKESGEILDATEEID